MDTIMLAGLALVVAALAVIVIVAVVAARRKKRARRRIDSLMPQMLELLDRERTLAAFDSGYLMKKDWDEIVTQGAPIAKELAGLPHKRVRAHSRFNDIALFLNWQADEGYRERRNAEFKAAEIAACEALFDDVDGLSLDARQRDAAVTNERECVVVGGAGTGKTLAAVAKVKYLVERRGIDPSRILVTTLASNAANGLAERLSSCGVAGVDCMDVEALGLVQLDGAKVADESELMRSIVRFLRRDVPKEPGLVEAFLAFYGCLAHLPKDYAAYGMPGERYQDLKAYDLVTLKGKVEEAEHAAARPGQGGFRGERVKSLEELVIANFLYLNKIDYAYGPLYAEAGSDAGVYRPSFYLPTYDIWWEHFGIDEDGRAPWMPDEAEEQAFLEDIERKRDVHRSNGTRLVESYACWNKQLGLLDKVESLLVENGVELDEDPAYLARIYNALQKDKRFMRGFVELMAVFLTLAKANMLTMEEVDARGEEAYAAQPYLLQRFKLFMLLATPMMASYRDALEQEGEVDRDDMLAQAAEAVHEGGLKGHYDYVVVDDCQNASKCSLGLLEAIRDASGAKLACFGDDWESTGRAWGADVTLFEKLAEHAPLEGKTLLEETFRNPQQLVDVANRFVEANPWQQKKQVVSAKSIERPIVVLASKNRKTSFESALDSIVRSQENYAGEILVLGRHSFDLTALYPGLKDEPHITFRKDPETKGVFITYRGYGNIRFLDVRHAEGSEADDVIVLNLTNSAYGFPDHVVDDPMLGLLLDGEDDYPLAEERRLFYVALTRTKGNVFLIADAMEGAHGASPFVKEIVGYDSPSVALYEIDLSAEPTKCPRCGTGNLVKHVNRKTGRSFVACTNRPYCDKIQDETEPSATGD